jgi:hypothetical protein
MLVTCTLNAALVFWGHLGIPSPVARDASLDDAETGAKSHKMEESRLARLEGVMDGFRAVPQITLTVLGIVMGAFALLVTIAIFAFNNLGGRVDGISGRVDSLGGRVDGVGARVDAIPKLLTEEFRAMRAETAAQTSAIANAITAAREVQPQIQIMPAPEVHSEQVPVHPSQAAKPAPTRP